MGFNIWWVVIKKQNVMSKISVVLKVWEFMLKFFSQRIHG